MTWALVTLALIAGLLVGLSFLAGHTVHPMLGRPGLIAFDSRGQIFTVSGDRTGLTQLTSGPAVDFEPVWSPDGKKLAYWSEPDPNVEVANLVVTDPVGRDPVVVGQQVTDPGLISWSPDSRRLAFSGGRRGGATMIFVADADRLDAAQVPGTAMPAEFPVWSPVGDQLAFLGGETAVDESIYLIPSTGGSPRELPGTKSASHPNWAPDGTSIAFASANAQHDAIRVVTIADGSLRTVQQEGAVNASADDNPAWSPDGLRLAIVRTSLPGGADPTIKAPPPAVWVFAGGAGDGFRLRSPGLEDGAPLIWSADGNWIIGFVSDPGSGRDRMAIIDSHGNIGTVVVPIPGNLGFGSWQRLP